MSQAMPIIPVVVDIVVNERRIVSQLHEELLVGDTNNLSMHMDEVSSRYAYYGVMRVLALREEKSAKLDLRKWMAEKKKEVTGTGKYNSETAKEDAVLTTYVEDYAAKTKAVIEAEYNRELLEVVEKAWEIKKDMLVSLGANARSERGMIGLAVNNFNDQVKGKPTI